MDIEICHYLRGITVAKKRHKSDLEEQNYVTICEESIRR